jgi:tetratricopeptide (TPR) repeat protein
MLNSLQSNRFIAIFLTLLLVNSGSILLIPIASATTPIAQSENSQKRLEAATIIEQGLQELLAKKYDEALPKLERALAIYTELGDRDWQGLAQINITRTYIGKKNLDRALVSCRAALNLLRDRQNKTRLGTIGNLARIIALSYRKQGDQKGEITAWAESIEVFRLVDNREKIANGLVNMGSAQTDIPDYPTALRN